MVIYGQETVIGYSDFGRESGGYGRNDKERHIPNISLQSMNWHEEDSNHELSDL